MNRPAPRNMGGPGAGNAGAPVVPLVPLGTKLIYRPGGLAGGGVFTSWALLMATFALTQGDVVIEIDDSIVSPALIPAGAWDLQSRATLAGKFKADYSQVLAQFQDGASLLNPTFFSLNLVLDTVSASPVVTLAQNQVVVQNFGAVVLSSGLAPFYSIPDGVGAQIVLLHFARLDTGTIESVDVGAGSTLLLVSLDGLCGYNPSTIRGGAAALFADFLAAANVQRFPAIQPNFLGTFIAGLFTVSEQVFYLAAAGPPIWAAPLPDDVQEAIDRLAVAVSGLLGGPIP